ncbi:MAG: hypothetical protein GXO47_03880 [Chlorobi bacterium]|nr:hypothetical protein [Chlorobiota bacterium]
MKNIKSIIILLVIASTAISAQSPRIPASYSNIKYDANGDLYYQKDGEKYYSSKSQSKYTIEQLSGNPTGTKMGIIMDFKGFKGTITYGLITYGLAPHPQPVYRYTKPLLSGKASINITKNFGYPFDFVNWQKNGKLTIGYRLIDTTGTIIFDGMVAVTGTGPFKVVPAIYEGPFINKLTDNSVTIWFNTTEPIKASVTLENGNTLDSKKKNTHHEFTFTNLEPGKKYDYTVKYGDLSQSYHFNTAPKNGSRKPFVFAYTSDSRKATGGGERNVFGANSYILKKTAALAYSKGAAFVQFTGDLVNGYLNNNEEMQLQFTNWKRAVEPFWHYIPFNTGIGNHESVGYEFYDDKGNYKSFIDGFPFNKFSAEAAFKEAFVNPSNGPVSEDNNKYDPKPKKSDFPSYDENTYYYTYDNVAIVVLNSDYWYAPSMKYDKGTSGGLHGYIMDNQLEWLKNTIDKLEHDADIDHVFVTQHTPAFPNGGHSGDDMWYKGNNEQRPFINGKPVDKGIIERRDEYLDILINKSSKVVAILTGDEHNYNRFKLTPDVTIYPENYEHPKLNISRIIYQINNGASGAPYYAQEKLPWSENTKSFSVENALCLFYVNGKEIVMKVINPDTLNEIDEIKLK